MLCINARSACRRVVHCCLFVGIETDGPLAHANDFQFGPLCHRWLDHLGKKSSGAFRAAVAACSRCFFCPLFECLFRGMRFADKASRDWGSFAHLWGYARVTAVSECQSSQKPLVVCRRFSHPIVQFPPSDPFIHGSVFFGDPTVVLLEVSL